MVATPEEIVNLGFDLIGETPVVSIAAPNTEAERFASRNYAQARDALLRRYIWNFAKTWKRLLANADQTLDTALPYSYTLPTDAVFVLRPSEAEWRVVGRAIFHPERLTDGLRVQVCSNAVPVPNFDPLFVDALAARFAVLYAERRTQSANKRQLAKQAFDEAIDLAKRTNALEEPSREVFPDHASSYLAGHDGFYTLGGFPRRAVVSGES